ncbi:MAG: porin [Proteobacteria bacterium]|nr:porin [Pseudomonadota bacterium]
MRQSSPNTFPRLAAGAALAMVASTALVRPAFAEVVAADEAAKPAAAEASAQKAAAPKAPAKKKDDGALTWKGVTLYGTFDVGVGHLDHGAKLSSYYSAGIPFVVAKFSNRDTTSIAPNGLSQSKLGVSGVEPLSDDVSAVFKLETGFQSTSLHLTNGPKSLIINNGVPLTAQTNASDTSRAGQLFQGAAYGGLASKTFGTLTFGRQTSLISDNLSKYDPQAQSQAFSPLGSSGYTAGGGATESARFDGAVKYAYAKGPFRAAYLHNFKTNNYTGVADEADVGGDWKGLSVDLTYTRVHDAITLASLSAAQNAAHPGTLAATASDNTAYAVEARYNFGKAKAFFGYEAIEMANPTHPYAPGFRGEGGYVVSVVSNTAYTIHRKQQISWVGVRYPLMEKLDVTGAYYRYDQNSFKGNGCSDTSASSCSGALQDLSVVFAYHLTKRFDAYFGVNHSRVEDGLASGYLFPSSTGEMAGVRFNF